MEAFPKASSGNWDELADHLNALVIGTGQTLRGIVRRSLPAAPGLTPDESAELDARIAAMGSWLVERGMPTPLWPDDDA